MNFPVHHHDEPPADIRLIVAVLVLMAIVFSILVTCVGIAYVNTIIPPPLPAFTPTQLDTL